jgi:hypothetical protein
MSRENKLTQSFIRCFEVLCTNGRNIAQDVGTSGTAGQSSGPAPSAQPSDARASQQGPLTTAAQPTDARASQQGPSWTSVKLPKGSSQPGAPSRETQPNLTGVPELALVQQFSNVQESPSSTKSQSGKASKYDDKDDNHCPVMASPSIPSLVGPRPKFEGTSNKKTLSHKTGIITACTKDPGLLEVCFPLPPNVNWELHILPIRKELAELLRVSLGNVRNQLQLKMLIPPKQTGLTKEDRRLMAKVDFYRADRYIIAWYESICETKEIPDLLWFIVQQANADSEALYLENRQFHKAIQDYKDASITSDLPFNHEATDATTPTCGTSKRLHKEDYTGLFVEPW